MSIRPGNCYLEIESIMRIALIKVQDTAKSSTLTGGQYPLNIAYLAAACQQQEHEVEIWDFVVEPFEQSYVAEKMKKFRPQVVGLSCVTAAIDFGNKLAGWIKQIDENIVTIIGGVHVTVLPFETMRDYPLFDLGVVTEGEETLPEILARLEENRGVVGIPGTIYREDGVVKMGPVRDFPDVNAIPFPNRKLVPMEWYEEKHVHRGVSRKTWNIFEVDSSRGCPFRCTFCNVEVTHGRRVRYRTPENVLAEIAEGVRDFGTNYVMFNDSTFTFKKSRVMELVSGLPKLGIDGYFVNGHVKTVNSEMLQHLAKTGCHKISFGVESGSQLVLDKIQKNATVEEIREAFRLAKSSGIPVVEGTFILGADIHETAEDFAATERLMKELQADIIGLGIITPFPGTAQYDEMKSLGYLDGVPWESYQIFSESPPPWRIINFSAEELVKQRNHIYKSYCWNFRYIFNRLRSIRRLSDLLYYAGMAKTFYKVVVRNT
ncbi:MAG: B12-binding domain-containing radical SAM protein [Magnetococcales bacterium]|nr:B12-binding domain-containing radical SAM protein [Magnetococcales bacterium]